MPSPNDNQFEMGRIPIRPLPYKNRQLAETNEFLIDYLGDDPSYHMYIVDNNDRSIYIDLTKMIIKEVLDNGGINADSFSITIEGVQDPVILKDLLNWIYKRFTYPENAEGFEFARDGWMLYDPTTKSVLLRDSSGTIYLPVTTADNVYDKNGHSLQERLDNMTRLGWSVDYLYAESPEQTSFEFKYPFPNYPSGGNLMEVRIGTTFVDQTRYRVIDDKDEFGDVVGGTIVFLNERIEHHRRIDLLFTYNAKSSTDGDVNAIPGTGIADGSIPTSKMQKVSDSYTLDDPSSLATSAGLYNLFKDMATIISENCDNTLWAVESSPLTNRIVINTSLKPLTNGMILNVVMSTNKLSTVVVEYNYTGDTATDSPKKIGSIFMGDESPISAGFIKNKTIRLLYYNNKFYLVSGDINGLQSSRFIHTCVDQETVISYSGLVYYAGCLIHVYRNGVRLFEDLDYTIDKRNENITLYVRTEEGERIVFEALYTAV